MVLSNVDTLYLYPDSISILVKLDTLHTSLNNKQSEWITIISLLIAFLAVFVGPLIQKKITKLQIENQNRNFLHELSNQNEQARVRFNEQIDLLQNQISAQLNLRNKQDWINLLRSDIAKFIKSISMIVTNSSDSAHQNEILVGELVLTSLELKLLLNDEEDQALLIELVDQAIDLASLNHIDPLKNLISENILPLAKRILIVEWENIQNSIKKEDVNDTKIR